MTYYGRKKIEFSEAGGGGGRMEYGFRTDFKTSGWYADVIEK